MNRRLRAALAVLALVGLVGVMVRLSVWQWDRGRTSGRFLNYSYAGEWLTFAVMTVVGAARLVFEDRRRSSSDPAAEAEEPVTPVPGARVPLVGPPLRPGEELEEITWVRLRRRLGVGAERQ